MIRRRPRLLGTLVLLALLGVVCAAAAGGTARAQDPPKAPAAAPVPATYETAPVKADELPAGVKIVGGSRCVSRAAEEFFLDPGYRGSLDAPPVRKSLQSFERAGGAAGTVLLFEYDGAVPSFIQRVLAHSLWEGGGRSPAHPDEFVVQGPLLWVLSFPYGDPTAEWVKDRLRRSFGVPARRTHADLDDLDASVWKALRERDSKAGVAALDARAADVKDWSEGWYVRGELLSGLHDPAGAEAAYRKALELHRTLADPLPANLAWAAEDGVGLALLAQEKYADAAKVLAASKVAGRALHLDNDDTPRTAYLLAVAYAQLGRWPDALRELTDAIDTDPRQLQRALGDDRLAAARKRPEFQVALEMTPAPRAPVPPKPKGPAKAAEPVSFDALQIRADELPKGWRLVKGPQCVSTSVASFFVAPDPRKIAGPAAAKLFPDLAPPAHKSCQSIVRDDGTAGSVVLFEFDEKAVRSLVPFLQGYFWGKGGPTNHSPEEILTTGPYLLVFSFPRGDAACEWVKERLRRRFGIPAPRTRPEIAGLMARIVAASGKQDADAGLRLLDARAAKLADVSFAWYLRGEFNVGKSNPAGSEQGYRRALDLHASLVDPLTEPLEYACLDGLGTALLMQKKLDEARKTLERAKAVAPGLGIRDVSGTDYNLACTYALLKRWDDALVALKAAIAVKPSWKASARDDGDLAEARKRPEFQALLAE